jgi:redox-sensitive bicupin YhaK (pirin superfamily)
MNTVIHKADQRGFADHGWLKTFHSFSFSGYYDPNKMGFGALRVLNDDTVQGGMGFGSHPHDNMEIISIPIKGSLAHKDNQGHEKVIHDNEVQIMSAGTGIVHSEYNASRTEEVNFFQIWILPKEKNIKPRYDQKIFYEAERRDKWQILVSPEEKTDSLYINQEAIVSRTILMSKDIGYEVYFKNSGLYLFVIEGEIQINDLKLSRRDALGITNTKHIYFSSKNNSEILLFEVPMLN